MERFAEYFDAPRQTLECSLRINGRRELPDDLPPGRSQLVWVVDGEALTRAVDAAVFWCADALPAGTRLMLSLRNNATPAASVEDAYRRAHEAAPRDHVYLWWETPEAFRVAVIGADRGSLSLGEGGADLDAGRWEPGFARLTRQLEESAAWAAQGRIKRAASRQLPGTRDWFAGGFYWSSPSYERFVPDAYGMQLVPTSLADVVAGKPGWSARPAGHDRSLLFAEDPAPWVTREVSPALRDEPLPAFVAGARAAFAPILLDRARDAALEPSAAPGASEPLPARRPLTAEHRRVQGDPRWPLADVAAPTHPKRRPRPATELKVAPAVVPEWRKRSAGTNKAWIALLLRSSSQTAQAVIAALRGAVDRARETLESDEASLGTWAVDLVPEGALLTAGNKAERFEETLGFVVDDLRRAGVTGALGLYTFPEPPRLPDAVDLIECRMRIRGSPGPGRSEWHAEPEAAARLLGRAFEWCLAGTATSITVLASYDGPEMALALHDVEAALLPGDDGTLPMPHATLRSLRPDGFRTIVLDARHGRLTLIEGGPALTWGAWSPVLDGIAALLRGGAGDLAYALVKRGSRVPEAESSTSLDGDWPARPSRVLDTTALEAEGVPDAFGLQLLGPGHLDRLPDGPSWDRHACGTDRLLLASTRPERFFAQRTAPFGGGRSSPAPDYLVAARRELAPLLLVAPAIGGSSR